MAEDLDSDTCVGFKRRISELSEIEGNQQSVEEQHPNSLFLEEQSSVIVSAAKEERETVRNSSDFASEPFNALQKKAKCSSSDESETNITVQEKQEAVDCELGLVSEGVKEKQEIDEGKLGFGNDVVMKLKNDEEDGVVGLSSSQLVKEEEKDLKKFEMGSSGIQEFGEVEKSSTSRSSLDYTGIEEKRSAKEVQMNSVVKDCNKGLANSYIAFKEHESGTFLKNKENLCLAEPEVESIAGAETCVLKFTDFEYSREIMGDTIKIKEESEHSSRVDGKLGIVESADTDEQGSGCEEVQKMVQSDGEKLDGLKGIGEAIKCSLRIEVIDETAVIETASASKVGNGCGKEKGFVGFAKHSERNGNKKNVKPEVDGKKEKRSRRRGKSGKKVSETNGKEKVLTHMTEARNGCEKKGDEAKRVYSRQEMEALRFVNVEEQRKKWIEVYCGLGPAVAKEYDGLVECNQQKHIRLNFDPRQRFGKKEVSPAILSEECSQNMDNEIENMNPLDPAYGPSVSDVDGCAVVEGECSEDDDSDEDYSSIQRPAFLVAGEPNFDSGPPEDGLEYLRRVRWEAAQISKVKVANLERSKLNKEQTVYMPKIPDIAKCPEHLLPLKQWEDEFLADFSELRLALSHLEGSSAKISGKPQLSLIVHEEENSHQLPESIILEKFDKLTTDGVESCLARDCSIPGNSSNPQSFPTADENDTSLCLENSSPKSFASGSCGESPTLFAILRMDSVARGSMLRKRISSAETMSTLSRNDCAWLFALCAAVDTPLDADMCAALRCLLRKSASLRAGKSDLDDEVIMLNILATISGRYFGQSEN